MDATESGGVDMPPLTPRQYRHLEGFHEGPPRWVPLVHLGCLSYCLAVWALAFLGIRHLIGG